MIIVSRPPNFDAILAAFPDADKAGVIFAFGNDIYNPAGHEIPSALLAHERVHCHRQSTDPEAWWAFYLGNPTFRYREELLAHVAEFRDQEARYPDRNARAKLLHSTARRLIAPLYNYQPPRSLSQALRDLEQELHL